MVGLEWRFVGLYCSIAMMGILEMMLRTEGYGVMGVFIDSGCRGCCGCWADKGYGALQLLDVSYTMLYAVLIISNLASRVCGG